MLINNIKNFFKEKRFFIFLKPSISINYIKMYFIILLPEVLLMDDEPIWEPLEWTLMQSFCLYLFLFS